MFETAIIYPRFNDCQNFTFDEYWKNIFVNCACNKFPRGIRYDHNKNILYVREASNNGVSSSIKLPNSSEELFRLMMIIFKDNLSLRSSQDIEKQNEELINIERAQKENLDCEWKKIKPRAVKDQLIMNYVVELKETFNLTLKETKKLLSLIEVGFQFKQLDSGDVEYSSKKIKNIQGLEYDETTKEFGISRKIKKNIKIDKATMPHKFDQALDQFAKEQNLLLFEF